MRQSKNPQTNKSANEQICHALLNRAGYYTDALMNECENYRIFKTLPVMELQMRGLKYT